MEGKDLIFVIRKILERSNIDTGQNKFCVPNSEVLWGLLSEAEKAVVGWEWWWWIRWVGSMIQS